MQLIAMIRHLPTTDDVNDLYTSASADPPLTTISDEVLASIRTEICVFIKKFEVHSIFASDNPRGRQSASVLLGDTPPADLYFDARLDNIRQPEWAGLHQNQVNKTSRYKMWHTKPLDVTFNEGESLRDVGIRTASFIADLKGRSSLIISHTTPLQALVCHQLTMDLSCIWTFKFDHLAFTLLSRNLLLRFNSDRISDVRLSELRLPAKD